MIGQALRILREFSGLKLKDVSERTGLAKGYISQIETGKRSPALKALEKLSSLFNVSSSFVMLLGENLGKKGMEGDMREESIKYIAEILKGVK